MVRNTTVSAKQETYIEAARGLGASNGWIMRTYLFGNVSRVCRSWRPSMPPMPLSRSPDRLLGLGIQPTEAGDWGFDLQEAPSTTQSGDLVDVAVSGSCDRHPDHAVTLVGEGLNETVNPTLRKRRLMPVDMPARSVRRDR